jgi:medium-chain acyl-[acyl-carrier-protein] hydrolase
METNGIWSEDLKIRAYMVDKNREANLVAIQNMCQEVAGNHANFRQLGYADMQAHGLAWVLNRLKIKVLQFPKWTETVTVKTWVSVLSPFSHRHFQIVLPNTGNHTDGTSRDNREGVAEVVLANIYSIWIPIDVVTKRPKRQVPSNLPLLDVVYDCELPEKLGNTGGLLFSSERQVQYADLDMLGHVNNAKYTEWLLDDFFRNYKNEKPNTLEINYVGEVFEDTTVQIFAQYTEGSLFYSVKTKEDGKEVIRAKLTL